MNRIIAGTGWFAPRAASLALLAAFILPGCCRSSAPRDPSALSSQRLLSDYLLQLRPLATMPEVLERLGKPDLWGEVSFDGVEFNTALMDEEASPTGRPDLDWAYLLNAPGCYLALRFGAGELVSYGTMNFRVTREAPHPLREREMWHRALKAGPSPTMEQVIKALGKPDLWGWVEFGGREFNTSLMTTHRLPPTGSKNIAWAYSLGTASHYLVIRFHDGRLAHMSTLHFRIIRDP